MPEGSQLRVTEAALDRWISAHYEFPGDAVPASRPDRMPPVIYEAVKRHHRTERIARGEDMSKPEKALPPGVEPAYRLRPPADYRHFVYPNTMAKNVKPL